MFYKTVKGLSKIGSKKYIGHNGHRDFCKNRNIYGGVFIFLYVTLQTVGQTL